MESQSAFTCRRAELRDAVRIQRLLKGGGFGRDDMERTLKRRFGEDYDIPTLIDTSPLSIVAVSQDDTTVLGFAAISLSPPLFVASKVTALDDNAEANKTRAGQLISGRWDEWIQKSYDLKDASIYNCAFFTFFHADPDVAVAVLDNIINIAFELLTEIKFLCYFLPESLILFPPFSSQRYQPATTLHNAQSPTSPGTTTSDAANNAASVDGRANRRRLRNLRRNAKYFAEVPLLNQGLAFSLQVCHRKEIQPVFRVRKARVEDCDDLVPMFRRQNLLKTEHADYFLANLVESKSDTVRTLVAEADGEVVGFMSINREIDQTVLHEQYHLEMFDYLVKDVKPVPSRSSESNGSVPLIVTDKAEIWQEPQADAVNVDELVAAQPAPPKLRIDSADAYLSQETNRAFDPEDVQVQNAFCINMFCIENAYASYSVELVRAAFQIFQGRDYCLMTMPPNTPEIQLLQHFSVVRQREGKIAPHNLYVANRFGIGEAVRVHQGTKADLDSIEALTFGLDQQEDILSAVRKSLSDTLSEFVFYVAEQGDQLAGVVVLSQAPDHEVYVDQYEVERFVSVKISPLAGRPVILRHAIFNPLFEIQARRVFREVLRQAQCPCLLFLVDDVAKRDPATQRVAIREMVPVRPRRMIEFPNNMRDEKPVLDPLPYNLQIISTSLIFEPRIVVNSRIVVLGGSDAGIAFLEHLVYTSHLHFTNLTLITKAKTNAKSNHYVSNRCYTPLERQQLALEYYVQHVYDTAESLDRESKLIRLGSGAVLAYNYLVLSPGMQYLARKLDEGLASLRGVYSIARHEEEALLGDIQALKSKTDSTAVVFGRSLQAYAAVELLLREGVEPSQIAIVDPVSPSKPTCFDDPVVEERVFGYINRVGIKHYRGHRILKWGASLETPQSLQGIVIINRETNEPLRLPSTELLLYADELSIDIGTFKFINDSCLVFDGRLVIDKFFRTQDPFIFAAGSLTKYASRYQTKWTHAHYDGREVGTKLGETLLAIFDPTVPSPVLEDSEDLLEFHGAKKYEAMLPDGQYYLHFDRPKLPGQAVIERENKQTYGRDLVIDRPSRGYFKIHLNPQGYIVSVTYFGKETIPTGNILCLYGMHEKYLNRLVARFDEGVIYDFVKFFNESWALPLFHDRFRLFVNKAREEGLASDSDEMREIVDHLSAKVSKNDMMLLERERGLLYRMFDQSADRKQWDAKVFEFLLDSRVFRSFP